MDERSESGVETGKEMGNAVRARTPPGVARTGEQVGGKAEGGSGRGGEGEKGREEGGEAGTETGGDKVGEKVGGEKVEWGEVVEGMMVALSAEQRVALRELVAKRNIGLAAAAARVNRRTVYAVDS